MCINKRRGHLSTVEVVKKVWKYATKQKNNKGQPKPVGSVLLSAAYTWILTAMCKHEIEMDNKK